MLGEIQTAVIQLLDVSQACIGRSQSYEWLLERWRNQQGITLKDLEDQHHRLLYIQTHLPDASDLHSSSSPTPNPSPTLPYLLDAKRSNILFLSETTRIVFVLDLGASSHRMMPGKQVSVSTEILRCLEKSILGTLQAMRFRRNVQADDEIVIQPKLIVTVIALTTQEPSELETSPYFHVLANNERLQSVEQVAPLMSKIRTNAAALPHQSSPTKPPPAALVDRHRFSFMRFLRAGTFILDHSPFDGLGSLCVITDGVGLVEPLDLYSPEIVRLHSLNATFSIIQCISPNCTESNFEGFGCLVNTEELQHLAFALGGNFVDSVQVETPSADSLVTFNFFHRFLLTLRHPLSAEPKYPPFSHLRTPQFLHVFEFTPFLVDGGQPKITVRFKEQRLTLDVWTVVGARLRQGFLLQSITSTPSTEATKCTVKFLFLWHPSVHIEYRVTSTSPWYWTADASTDANFDWTTRVEINVRCSADFANYFAMLSKYGGSPSLNGTLPALTFEEKGRALLSYLSALVESDELLQSISCCAQNPVVLEVPSCLSPIPNGHAVCLEEADLGLMNVYLRSFWLSVKDAVMSLTRSETAYSSLALDTRIVEVLLLGNQQDSLAKAKEYLHVRWSSFAVNESMLIRIVGDGFVVLCFHPVASHLVSITSYFIHVTALSRLRELEHIKTQCKAMVAENPTEMRMYPKKIQEFIPSALLNMQNQRSALCDSLCRAYSRTLERSFSLPDAESAETLFRILFEKQKSDKFQSVGLSQTECFGISDDGTDGLVFKHIQIDVGNQLRITFRAESENGASMIEQLFLSDCVFVSACMAIWKLSSLASGVVPRTFTLDDASDISSILPLASISKVTLSLPGKQDAEGIVPSLMDGNSAADRRPKATTTIDLLRNSTLINSNPHLAQDLLCWHFAEQEFSQRTRCELNVTQASMCGGFFRSWEKTYAMHLNVSDYRCFLGPTGERCISLIFLPSFAKELVARDYRKGALQQIPIYLCICNLEGMRSSYLQQAQVDDSDVFETMQLAKKDVRLLVNRSLAQAEYAAFLQGLEPKPMAPELSTCYREVGVEVDLTEYLNTLANVELSDESVQAIHKRFVEIVETYFRRHPAYPNRWYYCGGAPSTKKPLDFLEDAHLEPLHLRFECILRQNEEASEPFPGADYVMNEKVTTFEVEELPTSYRFGEKYFAPSGVGTIDSPIASADGQTLHLRLVYSILKTSDIVEASATDEGMPLRIPHMLLQLSPERRAHLVSMESDIEWLLKHEILHYLLLWKSRRLLTLEFVESMLRSISSRAQSRGYSPITTIPLTFIRQKRCSELIFDELGRMDLQPLCIQPVGKYLVVSPETLPQLPFWLFMAMERSNVVAVFYFSRDSPVEAWIALMQRCKDAIGKTCRRVNQIALLQELNETRYCSKYLLPPESASAHLDEDEGDEIVLQDGSHAKLSIGEFECDLLGQWIFPLHWRLKPAQMLANLSANVLHPLSVNNRKHTFVYATDESQFYMKLHESASEEGRPPLASPALSQDSVSPSVRSSASFEDLPGIVTEASSMGVSSRKGTTAKNHELATIRLEIFGVGTLGNVVDEIVSMIENKIVGVTLHVVSTMLSRNITLKLSPQDADFILPAKEHPKLRLHIGIPDWLQDVVFLTAIMKQNLLQFLATNQSPDLIQNLAQNLGMNLPPADAVIEDGESARHELSPGDMLFLYNASQPRQSNPNDFFVGKGIAAISIALLNAKKQRITRLPVLIGDRSISFKDHSSFTTECEPFSSPYTVCVSFWIQGSLSMQDLERGIRGAITQSVVDYATESTLVALEGILKTSEEASRLPRLLSLLDICSGKGTPSFQLSHKPIHRFTGEMREFLCDVNEVLRSFDSTFDLHTWKQVSGQHELRSVRPERHFSAQVVAPFHVDSEDSELIILGVVELHGASAAPEAAASVLPSLDMKESRLRTVSTLEESSIASSTRAKTFPIPHLLQPEDLVLHSCPVVVTSVGSEVRKNSLPRHCFVTVVINENALRLVAYNWNLPSYQLLSGYVEQVVSTWNQRYDLLHCALDQKMGLFHGPTCVNVSSWEEDNIIPLIYHHAETDMLTEVKRKRSTISNAETVAKYVSARDFAVTLKSSFFEYTPIEMSAAKFHDAVLRHCSTLVHVHVHDQAIKKETETIQSVFARWNQSGNDQALPIPDLLLFLRNVRLFHWCRTPLLFSPLRDSLFLLSGSSYICTYSDLDNQFADPRDYHSFPDEAAARTWFRTLTNTFTNDYVAYLESLGMQVVLRVDAGSDTTLGISPTFTLSLDLSVNTDVVYLQKSFHGGVLMVEVRLQDMFASINLYTSKIQLSGVGEGNRLDTEPLMEDFPLQCANFKNLIHVNSFVYDFHLRYMSLVMLEPHRKVRWLDFLHILRAFYQYNITTAHYAKNRIHKGVLKLPCAMSSEEMIKYVSRNNSQFQFRNIELKGRITACYYITNVADFSTGRTRASSEDVAYSLVIFPHDPVEDGPIAIGEIRINYFVIIASLKDRFPRLVGDKSHQLDRQLEALIPNAENRIRRSIELALRFYSRDSLWRRLVAPSARLGSKSLQLQPTVLTTDDFQILSSRYNTVPLSTFDPDLQQIWSLSVNWTTMLDFLAEHYGALGREFQERDNKNVRHLILLNPENSDLLLHFTVDLGRNAVDANAVSREPSVSEGMDGGETLVSRVEELEFVSDVVRTISVFLWTSATQ